MITVVVAGASAFLVSSLVVPMVRNIANKKGLLDVPNKRSSHRVPTPRTGGAGIFLGVFVGLVVMVALGDIGLQPEEWGFLGVLVAGSAVGFLDDVLDLPSAVRMLLYLGCAGILAYCGANTGFIVLPGLPSFTIGFTGSLIFGTLFVAWYTNLFNFMDGIDGIAGSAAAVTLGSLAIVFLANDSLLWGTLALACTAACLGFLVHNYPPASVFMGDGGAVFLGLTAGGLSLVAVNKSLISLAGAVLLMLPFVFDATFTLTRRIFRRERFWSAHRTHVYQQMCDLGLSHRAVSSVYTMLAVVFAVLGLTIDSMPGHLRGLAWWCSLALLLAASLAVVMLNGRRKLDSAE